MYLNIIEQINQVYSFSIVNYYSAQGIQKSDQSSVGFIYFSYLI